jgi:hypothetical protein
LTSFLTGDRDSLLTQRRNLKDSELSIRNLPRSANSPMSFLMMLPEVTTALFTQHLVEITEVKKIIMETTQVWRKEET